MCTMSPLVTFNVTSHFGPVPTAYRRPPVGPVRRSKASRGRAYGFYLEIPRPHLGSLDDPRALAVAVRVV